MYQSGPLKVIVISGQIRTIELSFEVGLRSAPCAIVGRAEAGPAFEGAFEIGGVVVTEQGSNRSDGHIVRRQQVPGVGDAPVFDDFAKSGLTVGEPAAQGSHRHIHRSGALSHRRGRSPGAGIEEFDDFQLQHF